MVTTETRSTKPAPGAPQPEARTGRSTASVVAWTLLGCLVVVVIVLVAHNARYGAVSPRIANPAVHGSPIVTRPLLGWTHWVAAVQIGAVVMFVVVVAIFAVAWSRHPKHPVLLMAIACTTLLWQDPIMNWAPYAVYNPRLWHWPETWPLVSISPTVEPFVVIPYVTFYLGPGLLGIWVLRRIQRRRPVTSFFWRHPLVSLGFVVLVLGFVIDAMLEIFLVRTQMYIYAQVIPFGSVFTGKPYQFPLLWESVLVTTVMIPAGILIYRDDTGRSVAEKLARRLTVFTKRPALGSFLVMVVILNACYFFLYGGSFAAIRASGAATSVACPYPFPEAKVYDPQGYWEKAGQPGPYMAGIWSGWESGQSGRPAVSAPASGGRCTPASAAPAATADHPALGARATRAG